MCIAIVKPAGTVIDESVLKTCFENNPDGAGFAYRTPDGLVVEKGLFTWEAFIDAYRARNVADVDALIHFRITTKGDDSPENTHPFAIQAGALIHNGTISHLGERRGVPGAKSDTRELAEKWDAVTLDEMERFFDVFEHYVDDTRVAVMGHDGRVIVFNRKQWIEKDGVLYSNRGFEMDVYGWSAHRAAWGAAGRPASLLDSARDEDVEDPVGAYEYSPIGSAQKRAELWLDGGYDGEWCWIGTEFYVVYNGQVCRDKKTEDEIIDAFTTWYGVAPQGREAEWELESMTEMYIDNGYTFEAANAA